MIKIFAVLAMATVITIAACATEAPPTPTPIPAPSGCSLDERQVDCAEFYNRHLVDAVTEWAGDDCTTTATNAATRVGGWELFAKSGAATLDEFQAVRDAVRNAGKVLECEHNPTWQEFLAIYPN